jgi:luciferase family oxidoreductase group 1
VLGPSVTRPDLFVLDLSPIGTGQSSADALAATPELARAADDLGYRRFWVVEHHAMPEALHPGRVDLGIGRAPGTDPRTAAALRRSPEALGAEDLPQQLLDVLAMLGDERMELPEDPADPLAQDAVLAATPAPTSSPQVWLLGSRGYSARLAGLLGLPFCFAHHLGVPGAEQALALYRDSIAASPALAAPHMMVSAGVLLAPTQEEADVLARPGLLLRRDLRTGRRLSPLLGPEEAAAVRLDEAEERALAAMPTGGVTGTPDAAVTHLQDLVAHTGADELLVTTTAHARATRVRTMELLAQSWRVPAAA